MDGEQRFLFRTSDMPATAVEWQKDRSGCRWMTRDVRKGCIHEQCIGGAPDLRPNDPGPVCLPIVSSDPILEAHWRPTLGNCMYCSKPVLLGDQAEQHFSHAACEEAERLAEIERRVRELADRIESDAEPVLEDTECIVDELRALIDYADERDNYMERCRTQERTLSYYRETLCYKNLAYPPPNGGEATEAIDPEKVTKVLGQRDEAVALLRELIWAVRSAHTDTQGMLADRGEALLRRVGGSDE